MDSSCKFSIFLEENSNSAWKKFKELDENERRRQRKSSLAANNGFLQNERSSWSANSEENTEMQISLSRTQLFLQRAHRKL